MAIKKVVQLGHPLLKGKNKKVNKIGSTKIKRLIKDLKDTMRKTGLIGIAAPQIAENQMVFITHPRNTKSRKLGKTDKLRIYINPKFSFKSKTQNVIYEGCGSVVDGDLFGPVKRSREIEVKALDQNGKKFRLRCNGILARVIQHEYDHLMGIEFIDKVDDYKKLIVGKYYRRNIRNSKEQKQNSLITKLKFNSL